MNRLTKYHKQQGEFILNCLIMCDMCVENKLDCCSMQDRAIQSLGKYEDIGLTPAEITDLIEQQAKEIEELKEQVPKWISVEERLPENGETVLVHAVGTARNGNARCVATCHRGFWFMPTEVGRLSFPNMQFKVTHWQPIPEPPKGE